VDAAGAPGPELPPKNKKDKEKETETDKTRIQKEYHNTQDFLEAVLIKR